MAEKYRTRNGVDEGKIISKCPKYLSIVTDKRFQYALSFYRKGKAFLLMTGSDSDSIKGDIIKRSTLKGVEDINLPILWAFYSILLQNLFDNGLDEHGYVFYNYNCDSITVYVPELVRYIGLGTNYSTDSVEAVLSAIRAYDKVVGYLTISFEDGDEMTDYFDVLKLKGYDTSDNTITVLCPYLDQLVKEVLELAIKTKNVYKEKKVVTKKDGYIIRNPSHSYLIKPSIVKQRDHAAAENVYNIIALIEQAGEPRRGHKKITIHKNMSDLVKANRGLYNRLDSLETASNKNRLLKSVFTNTYRLLQNETLLFDKYPDITISDYIPTMNTLENGATFEVKHGKN